MPLSSQSVGWDRVGGCGGAGTAPARPDTATTISAVSEATPSGGVYAGIDLVASRSDAERIKALQDLCAQLDVLQKQATAICEKATAEIERARRADQRERRVKQKKVKRDRRR